MAPGETPASLHGTRVDLPPMHGTRGDPAPLHGTYLTQRACLRPLAAQAAQEVTFWGVFYPWVFAYLGLYFLRVSQTHKPQTHGHGLICSLTIGITLPGA